MQFLDLPVEVLLLVYHRLSDIDDALHLARTCKRLTAILDSPFSRVNIFRAIIQSQRQHQHDAQLTILQSLNQTYLPSLNAPTGLARSLSRPKPDVLNQALFPTHRHRLSDDEVWAIVCRWHGLRSLFALYTNRTIHNLYLTDWSPWWHSQAQAQTPSPLLHDHPFPQLSDQPIPDPATHNNRPLYHRFYQALTAHWLSIESLVLAKSSVYPSPQAQWHWHAIIHAHWSLRCLPLSLQERLDILHVALFVWEFLARKLFESVPLLPRICEFRQRKIFLRPPCLIHALVLMDWPGPESMADPMRFLETVTPEFMVQPVVRDGVYTGNESEDVTTSVDVDGPSWDMGLQDLETAVHEDLRGRRGSTSRATWRSFWPVVWRGGAGNWAPVGFWPGFGDGRLDVGVLDRAFRCHGCDERVLWDLLGWV